MSLLLYSDYQEDMHYSDCKGNVFFGIKVAYFSFLVLVAYLGSARVIVLILLRRSRYLLPVDIVVYSLKQAAAPPQNSLDSFNFL